MPRPVMLGIVGDSGSGKSTITRGLVRVLGADQVSSFSTDDYHRHDRRRRAELDLTPLDPDANHLDILAQHLETLLQNKAVLKPVYRHADGTFGPPVYFEPARYIVAQGMLAFYDRRLADAFDVRVYLDPPEETRRHWKVRRDSSRRGYTTDAVLSELDRRELDAERFIRPQRHLADIIVSFQPGARADQEHLDCRLTLRDTLSHPDLTGLASAEDSGGIVLVQRQGAVELNVPGEIPPERVAEIEAAIWEKMHFASDLRQERLGEFTIGTDLRRSDSLALVQLLLLYHLVTARAVVAVGGRDASARTFDLSRLDRLVSEGASAPE